jgi:adenine phosphoribosyltransferase
MSDKLRRLIRMVPDFPKPGIVFRDITPLLADAEGLGQAGAEMADPWREKNVDLVVGAESRGFIFGSLVARELNCGFVPVRKPGKLPHKTIARQYELEYGADQLQIHADAVQAGQRILMVDDLLATGGTMEASCQMIEQLGGDIVGIGFLIELTFLNGRDKIKEYKINSLISYDTE